jgi:hypothetical protein
MTDEEERIMELEVTVKELLTAASAALAILDVIPYEGCVDGNCRCLRCETNRKLISAIARGNGELVSIWTY